MGDKELGFPGGSRNLRPAAELLLLKKDSELQAAISDPAF